MLYSDASLKISGVSFELNYDAGRSRLRVVPLLIAEAASDMLLVSSIDVDGFELVPSCSTVLKKGDNRAPMRGFELVKVEHCFGGGTEYQIRIHLYPGNGETPHFDVALRLD